MGWERKRNNKIIKPYATDVRTMPNMWGYCSMLQKLWNLEHLIFGVWCAKCAKYLAFGTFSTSIMNALKKCFLKKLNVWLTLIKMAIWVVNYQKNNVYLYLNQLLINNNKYILGINDFLSILIKSKKKFHHGAQNDNVKKMIKYMLWRG